MTDHADPTLAHLQPVPGGLYRGQPYDAALADLRSAVAQVSAALRGADGTHAEQLIRYQQDLNRAQLQLRQDEADAQERDRRETAAAGGKRIPRPS